MPMVSLFSVGMLAAIWLKLCSTTLGPIIMDASHYVNNSKGLLFNNIRLIHEDWHQLAIDRADVGNWAVVFSGW